MRFPKYKILLLLTFIANSLAFSGSECFDSNFDISISHKSAPFGLLSRTIKIQKEKCIIKIHHNKYKYINESWIVDVCRDPVHIKETTTTVEVIRKIGACSSVRNTFCSQYLSLRKLIEDDGLIFATGDKSDLLSDHGKAYCSYVLLNRYLGEGLIFNTGVNYDYITQKINSVDREQADSDVVDQDALPGDF